MKNDSKSFGSLFTKTPDSQTEITISTDSAEQLDISVLVEQIRKQVPIDASSFVTKFSTTTGESQLAMNAAFADAVSPYYEYSSSLCGIPRIKRLGTKEDWLSLEENVKKWQKIFENVAGKEFQFWLVRVEFIVRTIHSTNDLQFWSKFFSLGCGSGHPVPALGWLAGLYRSAIQVGENLDGEDWVFDGGPYFALPGHISAVKWRNKETSRQFALYAGLLYSKIDTAEDSNLGNDFPFLIPQFGHAVQEETANHVMCGADRVAYLMSLEGPSRFFIADFQRYQATPILIEGGAGFQKQRVELLLAKFYHLKQGARRGDVRAEHLELDHSIASLLSLSCLGKRSIKDRADYLEENAPRFKEVLLAALEVLKVGRTVRKVKLDLSESTFVGIISDELIESLRNHRSVTSLSVSCDSAESEKLLGQILAKGDSKIAKLTISSPEVSSACADAIVKCRSLKALRCVSGFPSRFIFPVW